MFFFSGSDLGLGGTAGGVFFTSLPPTVLLFCLLRDEDLATVEESDLSTLAGLGLLFRDIVLVTGPFTVFPAGLDSSLVLGEEDRDL